jgi:hypothetical protein
MGLFLVTYDLMKPGQSYQTLFDALAALGAKRILLSTWVLKSASSAAQLRDHFRQYIDDNDRLFVCQISDWAGYNLMYDINQL